MSIDGGRLNSLGIVYPHWLLAVDISLPLLRCLGGPWSNSAIVGLTVVANWTASGVAAKETLTIPKLMMHGGLVRVKSNILGAEVLDTVGNHTACGRVCTFNRVIPTTAPHTARHHISRHGCCARPLHRRSGTAGSGLRRWCRGTRPRHRSARHDRPRPDCG